MGIGQFLNLIAEILLRSESHGRIRSSASRDAGAPSVLPYLNSYVGSSFIQLQLLLQVACWVKEVRFPCLL